MTNFTTSRIHHIYQSIESHFLSVSILAKKRFSSSGPVRYIPGRCTQIKKSQNFASLQGSVKKEDSSIHVVPIPDNYALGSSNLDRRPLQNSHFNDESFGPDYDFDQIGECLGTEEFEEPVEQLFDANYENMDELNAASKVHGDGFRKHREEIEKVAVSLIAARAMTAIELRKKLVGKKYPSNIVESVVSDFKSRGLLNDSLYAESFTRSRWLSSTWGPRKIKQALLQKGLSETETERARKVVFEEEDEPDNDDQNLQHGMCRLSMNHLFLQASKQWLKSRDVIIDNRRARIVRWLQYRGFDWGVTNYILRKLESQYPT